MPAFVATVRGALEGALSPLHRLPAEIALGVSAVLCAVVTLAVLKVTTKKGALETARDRMASAILEMRLYLDAPRRVLYAQARLLGWSLRYVALTLPSLLVLAPTLGLVLVHHALRYEYAPLPTGEQVLLRVDLSDAAAVEDLVIKGPDELEVTAPPFRDPEAGRAYLRLKLPAPETYTLVLTASGATVNKILVADPEAPASLERSAGWSGIFTESVEPPLPAGGPFRHISIPHPAAHTEVWGMPWWAYWLLVTMVAVFALRRPMGVAL